MEMLLAWVSVWGEPSHSLKISLCSTSLYCAGVLGSGRCSGGISIAHCCWNNSRLNLTAQAPQLVSFRTAKPATSTSSGLFKWLMKGTEVPCNKYAVKLSLLCWHWSASPVHKTACESTCSWGLLHGRISLCMLTAGANCVMSSMAALPVGLERGGKCL